MYYSYGVGVGFCTAGCTVHKLHKRNIQIPVDATSAKPIFFSWRALMKIWVIECHRPYVPVHIISASGLFLATHSEDYFCKGEKLRLAHRMNFSKLVELLLNCTQYSGES